MGTFLSHIAAVHAKKNLLGRLTRIALLYSKKESLTTGDKRGYLQMNVIIHAHTIPFSAAHYTEHACSTETVFEASHYKVLRASTPDPVTDIFCRVIFPHHEASHTGYDVSMLMLNRESRHGPSYGSLGAMYNVVDENTFEYVLFR